MKCRHPECKRKACDVPPIVKIMNDAVDGREVRTRVVIDEAKDAGGYCCLQCKWSENVEHSVRCNRRAKGLPEVNID